MMARGKVQMRRIENPVHRQVTFCKRRMGLLKKANELSVLCDADIGVIVFSPHGKMYELVTNGNMQVLIERYKTAYGERQGESSGKKKPQAIPQEVLALTREIELLQKGLRYMYGENDINHMSLDELESLENNLEIWVQNIRSQKMQIMSVEIEMLRNKVGSGCSFLVPVTNSSLHIQGTSSVVPFTNVFQEGILQATNDILQERISEQNGILNASGSVMVPQVPFQLNRGSNCYF
ncbi:hypothetical protein GQ55_7G153300 [Panicum hallii var. hallii]|uniref:MADS-box domain-containing protein n=1 Tax=Panicum hallii var. hallii TaxID=1504633 RepID=A0A2T7CVL8_9POAL|nr:hypothetical protein GQ55_7G153300 [Panicum hallii var. hallii]